LSLTIPPPPPPLLLLRSESTSPIFHTLEEKTKVQKELLVIGAVAFLFMILFFGVGAGEYSTAQHRTAIDSTAQRIAIDSTAQHSNRQHSISTYTACNNTLTNTIQSIIPRFSLLHRWLHLSCLEVV